MLILAGIVLSVAIASFVLSPLLLQRAAPLTDGPDAIAELRELYALRDVAYETIRDVDFDFHAGKISAQDHHEMTERYTREAMRLVQRIDALEAGRPGSTEGRRGRT
jgi:hypothetical protein